MEKLNYIELFKVPKFYGGGETTNLFTGITDDYYKRSMNKANDEYTKWLNENSNATETEQAAKKEEILNKTKTKKDHLKSAEEIIKGGFANAVGVDLSQAGALGEWGAIGFGGAGKIADIGMKAVGALTTGDKNFSTQSQAADAAVGSVTSALMQTKNPYLMAAAGGITAVNELTKIGGQSVPGFEVDISSSGYGDIGSMEESSSRGFFAATKQDEKRLDNRNEKAALALAAASVSDDQSFQQEARMNASQNVIQNNQWALDGGVSTDLLAAKKGAKLNKIENPLVKWLVSQMLSSSVEVAKNGAKLNKIEVSEEENVIPTGDLHKNKHNLDLENITKKGIPVIQNIDDSVETFEEVKEHEDEIIQSAEIEALEIIFNKEVTEFIESRMDKSSDKEVCKEVGMRICKEILFNTKDKEDLIETINKKDDSSLLN